VIGNDEVVSRCQPLEQGIEIAVDQLDYAVALRAEKMVVMGFAAEAVVELASPTRDCVDDAFPAEHGEGAIDGGESDLVAPVVHCGMDLLSCRSGVLA
jgi:hypothetical protein